MPVYRVLVQIQSHLIYSNFRLVAAHFIDAVQKKIRHLYILVVQIFSSLDQTKFIRFFTIEKNVVNDFKFTYEMRHLVIKFNGFGFDSDESMIQMVSTMISLII